MWRPILWLDFHPSVIKDDENLLMCLFGIWVSSCVSFLFTAFYHLLLGLFLIDLYEFFLNSGY